MRLHKLRGFLVTSWLALTMASTAFGQQASSLPQRNRTEKSNSRCRKVWTNDDVAALRGPSDVYIQQKLAADERASGAKKAALEQANRQPTTQERPSGANFVMPKTVESRTAHHRETRTN